jgi:hypothetical protein
MSNIYKTSRTTVRAATANDRFIYLLESENPEIKLSRQIRDFLQTVGYSQLFPNFDNIRVGTIHPFAILLAQDVLGQTRSANVFPSITVVDSTLQEDAEVLADEYTAAMWSPEDIINIGGYREAGEVFCSDAGWAKIQERVTEKGQILGVTKQYHTSHRIDFNIWSENKEVTSFLFDMVSHFVTQKRIDLHDDEGYDLSGIQGRRSGDINLDFGKLLYGSNLTVTLALNQRATVYDTAIESIASLDTQTLPTYFTLGAV